LRGQFTDIAIGRTPARSSGRPCITASSGGKKKKKKKKKNELRPLDLGDVETTAAGISSASDRPHRPAVAAERGDRVLVAVRPISGAGPARVTSGSEPGGGAPLAVGHLRSEGQSAGRRPSLYNGGLARQSSAISPGHASTSDGARPSRRVRGHRGQQLGVVPPDTGAPIAFHNPVDLHPGDRGQPGI